MKNHFTRLPLLLALTLGAAASVRAATLNVPAQYPTIQAGINAASPGDTVLIADGTYQGAGNVNLDYGGKAITVASQDGPAATIIDCQKIVGAVGFTFISGETAAAKLQGVTIENAVTVAAGLTRSKALMIDGSSPTISNCILANNLSFGGPGSALYITNVNAVGTTSPMIIGCTFQGNSNAGGASGGGGAAALSANSADGVSASFIGCSFVNNTSSGTNAMGGALYFRSSANATLTGCTFSGNQAPNGGAIYATSGSQTLVNCVFTGNSATTQGGAICNAGVPTFTLMNCTISANTAPTGAGLSLANGVGVAITNCIIYKNGGGGGDLAVAGGTFPAITYSDVPGVSGTGDIGSNPLLVNAPGDLHPRTQSPCYRAGTTQGAPLTDISGAVRPVPPSMGAYELSPALMSAAADSAVLSGAPTQNFGSAPTLVVGGFLGAAFLQFDLTALSPLASTSTVKLRLNAGRARSGAASLIVSATGSAWTEAGLTFQNRPPLGLPLGFLNVSADGLTTAPYDMDVTAYVKGQQALGITQVSLALTQFAPGVPVSIDSEENPASDGPQLIVIY